MNFGYLWRIQAAGGVSSSIHRTALHTWQQPAAVKRRTSSRQHNDMALNSLSISVHYSTGFADATFHLECSRCDRGGSLHTETFQITVWYEH